jgi:hypothetical protein
VRCPGYRVAETITADPRGPPAEFFPQNREIARNSVGPELVHIQGTNHSHLVLTGNVTWDLAAPVQGRRNQVTPFIVVGAGMFQTRETFLTGNFTSTEGAFTAGGGVRAAVTDRVTIGFEVRVGWETHIRIGGLVGVRLGR